MRMAVKTHERSEHGKLNRHTRSPHHNKRVARRWHIMLTIFGLMLSNYVKQMEKYALFFILWVTGADWRLKRLQSMSSVNDEKHAFERRRLVVIQSTLPKHFLFKYLLANAIEENINATHLLFDPSIVGQHIIIRQPAIDKREKLNPKKKNLIKNWYIKKKS